METVIDFIFVDFKITADGDSSHEIKKTIVPWKKSYDKPGQQRYHFANKCQYR